MLPVKVQDGPRELRAAVLAMRRADKAVRSDVSQQLRSTLSPEWATTVAQHLTGLPQERILLAGARIAPGNPPALVAANSRRRTGRGLIPTQHWAGWEYGAADHTPTTYQRANRITPGSHPVTRDTKAGLPPRRAKGRVLGPAVAYILPRACAFWVQSVLRAFLDAADNK